MAEGGVEGFSQLVNKGANRLPRNLAQSGHKRNAIDLRYISSHALHQNAGYRPGWRSVERS